MWQNSLIQISCLFPSMYRPTSYRPARLISHSMSKRICWIVYGANGSDSSKGSVTPQDLVGRPRALQEVHSKPRKFQDFCMLASERQDFYTRLFNTLILYCMYPSRGNYYECSSRYSINTFKDVSATFPFIHALKFKEVNKVWPAHVNKKCFLLSLLSIYLYFSRWS